MLQHAIATFERREHNERESLELRAHRRRPLRCRQARDSVRHIAIDQDHIARPVRDVEQPVGEEEPPPRPTRLIGTLSDVLGFNLGGGNWPCRGVVKIGW